MKAALPKKSAFIGREGELKSLRRLKDKNTSSLVCILGRRRIGKSALIEEFGKEFKSFTEIQGLGPETKHSHQDQLDHFASELSFKFDIRKPHFTDWDDAFEELGKHVSSGEHLVLLDEISWMARGDDLFSAKLKSAWDIKFKKNPHLILVLCGSVSTWLQDNLLKNANFEGRISLQINLQELSLKEINAFWESHQLHYGALEKMMLLSVCGGVPKYLEELAKSEPVSKSMAEICFNPHGILYNDFKKIFHDIFERKSKSLERMVRFCLNEHLSPTNLAQKLEITQDGDFSKHLEILELSGFLSRDHYFSPLSQNISKLSRLRIKDNYLRFYLKIIEPQKPLIEKGAKRIYDFTSLKVYDSILGLQFENLILSNRHLVHQILQIPNQQLVSSAPYWQNKLTTNKGACQIDLLIQSDLDVFYLCEMKCQKRIDKKVCRQVQQKIEVLKLPKRSALKPVLIYLGELDPNHENEIESYFYKVIPFDAFFKV